MTRKKFLLLIVTESESGSHITHYNLENNPVYGIGQLDICMWYK